MNNSSDLRRSIPGPIGPGPALQIPPRWRKGMLAAVLICILGGHSLPAQLAITEVMSWASNTECPDMGYAGCYPDFWELTNFGTNTVDLSGYLFLDKDAEFPGAALSIPQGVTLQPGESIVFVRAGYAGAPDASGFRRWWGESNLPATLQIHFYSGIGFDNLGDAVRLWDANSNQVDQIYFGETRRGFTFTCDPQSGEPVQSEPGVHGAFQAAVGGDVGSPGLASCGPVELRITQQPVSQTVDAGNDVTFSVRASGAPMPRGYQWYFSNVPLSHPPAVADTVPAVVNYAGCGLGWTATPKATDLILSNVQPAHAGQYFVLITNGLMTLTSEVVTLTVNTNPVAPRLECPPAALLFPRIDGNPQTNLTVAPWQAATLAVLAHGYPPPRYQWSHWNTNAKRFDRIGNGTNASLVIYPAVSEHAGIYQVCVTNRLGAITNFACLTVKPKPQLKITEAMSDECLPTAKDWWELTNMGNEPVDLYGYRWDDEPGAFGGGPMITNRVILQPGESVIFLEGQIPESFVNWWGASNLPPRLQFIYYTANGFETDGDEINVWNPTAMDDYDWVDSVVFSTPTRGVSFWFAPELEGGEPSVPGQGGAFRAAQGCDVGSPGWTALTPPCLTFIRREGSVARFEWKAQPGSTNLLQYTDDISMDGVTVWSDLGTYTSPVATCRATDTLASDECCRFYRVKAAAPAPGSPLATAP